MTEQPKVNLPSVFVQLLFVVVLLPLLPMIISSDWGWGEGWVSAVVFVFGFISSRALTARRHADLIVERARSMDVKNAKPWDRILAPLVAFGSVFIFIAAGLDHRYGWSSAFPLWAKVVAVILMIAGYALGTWAMMENRFFSGTVRIQTERGHRVVTSGPYRFIRHPGYAGVFLVYLLNPILFDSAWSLIPAVLILSLLVLRTALEDATLQTELPGYAEYAQKTRYRLLPGVW